MKDYPLLFTFRDKVDGKHFVAEVTFHGRTLAVEEQDGWWMYGVIPGDIAESGATALEAHNAFRKTFTEVLRDIASSCRTFSAFQAEVQRWFGERNEAYQKRWDAAVEEVRAGRVTADLEQKPAESARFVEVQLLKKAEQLLRFDPPMTMAA